MIFTVLTDKKNRIVKSFTDKKLTVSAGEHLQNGHGQTVEIPLSEFLPTVEALNQHQCISLGIVAAAATMQYDIKSSFQATEGEVQRTKDWFSFSESESLMIFDLDSFEGTIDEGIELLEELDPAIKDCAMVALPSSSGEIYCCETGEKLSKKNNFHLYIAVSDGTLIRDYGKILFDLCVLKGLGHIKVTKNSGNKRLHTIFDSSVWSATNREIFVSSPVLCEGLESRRFEASTYREGSVLDISKSISSILISPEDRLRLNLVISDLRTSESVIEESKKQRKNGSIKRAESRARNTGRKLKIELGKEVNGDEWIDKSGVLHTYLGANDYILDSNGEETKIMEILLNPEDWSNKPIPDPTSPYKRGDESRGIVGQGIAYVRVNENDSIHIFSFYNDVEYHLIWDMESIILQLNYLFDVGNQDELDAYIDYVFDIDAVNHKLSSTEITTIGRKIADINKELNLDSTFGVDARSVPAELKERTKSRDVVEQDAKAELVDESHITRLNAVYGMAMYKGKARVISENYSTELHEWMPDFTNIMELKTVFKNDRVVKQVGGKAKSTGVFDDWELSVSRNSFDRVVFEPKNDVFRINQDRPIIKQGGQYNMWMGYMADLTKAVSCDKILWHIKNVWCSGNDSIYDYTIAWLAELFQNPAKVGQPYLVLKSSQGAGKNIIMDKVICRLLGVHGISTANKEDLIGRFNSHLGFNVFLFLDEAIFAGDPRSKNLMKSLINEFREVEQKGVNKEKARNFTKIIMATNEAHAANVELDDRRHVYLPVSNEMLNNEKYFKELLMEIENGGREAFLDYMLKHQSDINLNIMPDGQSSQRQADIEQSAPAPVKFVFDLYENGSAQYDIEGGRTYSSIEFAGWGERDVQISKAVIMELFRTYCIRSSIRKDHMDTQAFFASLATYKMYANRKKSAKVKEAALMQEYGRDRNILLTCRDQYRND